MNPVALVVLIVAAGAAVAVVWLGGIGLGGAGARASADRKTAEHLAYPVSVRCGEHPAFPADHCVRCLLHPQPKLGRDTLGGAHPDGDGPEDDLDAHLREQYAKTGVISPLIDANLCPLHVGETADDCRKGCTWLTTPLFTHGCDLAATVEHADDRGQRVKQPFIHLRTVRYPVGGGIMGVQCTCGECWPCPIARVAR